MLSVKRQNADFYLNLHLCSVNQKKTHLTQFSSHLYQEGVKLPKNLFTKLNYEKIVFRILFSIIFARNQNGIEVHRPPWTNTYGQLFNTAVKHKVAANRHRTSTR